MLTGLDLVDLLAPARPITPAGNDMGRWPAAEGLHARDRATSFTLWRGTARELESRTPGATEALVQHKSQFIRKGLTTFSKSRGVGGKTSARRYLDIPSPFRGSPSIFWGGPGAEKSGSVWNAAGRVSGLAGFVFTLGRRFGTAAHWTRSGPLLLAAAGVQNP